MSVRGHLALGSHGEDLAAAHLRRDGIRVLTRNWRCRDGELDIVAIDGSAMVFCEVKSRKSLRFGTPLEAIDAVKAARIRQLARLWQAQNPRRGRHRFDAVCIIFRSDGTATVDHRRGVLLCRTDAPTPCASPDFMVTQ